MRKNVVLAIFKRDLRSWFGNPTGYVFITLFVMLSAFALVTDEFFQNNLANLDTLNRWFRVLLLFFVPAVTMGMWASERYHGTDELLATLPARDWEILLGKYLAAAGIYTIALLFTFSLPVGLWFLGSPDFGLILSNYLGFWLLGVMLISVSMLGSQLTSNLTVSFILGALFCAIVVFAEDVLAFAWPALARSWGRAGPTTLFREMGSGVISPAALLLYLGLTVAFFYVNLALFSKRHWKRTEPEGVHRGVRFVALVVSAISLSVIGLNRLPHIDATSERLHSLSDETLKILSELDPKKPVYVQAFVSEEVPREFVQKRATLLNLLREYDALGGDAVRVRIVPTERFTDAAREAETNFDIRHRTEISEEGSRVRTFDIYMGVAFQCGVEEVVIPFMDLKLPVEYEITRAIRVVSKGERRKIGVLRTDVDMFGGFDFQTMRSRPEWELITELKRQYKVEAVDPDQDYPGDVDVLIAPMASSLTQEQMDRLLTHVKSGKPTLIIDDPYPASAPGTGPLDPKGGRRNPFLNRGQPPPGQKGDIRSMLRKLNVEWPYTEIVWQQFNPHPQLELAPPEIVFVTPGSGVRDPFNPNEPITSGLQEVVAIYGGHVRSAARPDMTFTPLIRCGGPLSGTIDKNEAFENNFPFGERLNPYRRHRRDGIEKVLAARIGGKADKDAEKDVNLIFLADLDMVGTTFFRFRQRGLGDTKIEFDNVTFILNCVDYLAGDSSFIELRKRRPKHRTLEVLERQQEEFDREYFEAKARAEEKAKAEAEKEQKRFDEEVAKVRENKELDARSREIQIAAARAKAERRLKLRKEAIENEKRRAIEAAFAAKRAKQERIENLYRALTLAGTPLPAIAVGLLIFFRRRKRELSLPGRQPSGGAA